MDVSRRNHPRVHQGIQSLNGQLGAVEADNGPARCGEHQSEYCHPAHFVVLCLLVVVCLEIVSTQRNVPKALLMVRGNKGGSTVVFSTREERQVPCRVSYLVTCFIGCNRYSLHLAVDCAALLAVLTVPGFAGKSRLYCRGAAECSASNV